MWELERGVIRGAEGAGKAPGGELGVAEPRHSLYEPMKRNATLLEAFRANLRTFGVSESPELKDRLGSSDIGNVSQVIPAIQPMVKIAPDGTPIHSRAFEAAAKSSLAREGMLTAAKAMALTALDLLADPSLVGKAQAEFRAAR